MSDQPHESDVVRTAWVHYPPPILEAIASVPDLATALGELRCFAGNLLVWVTAAKKSGEYSGGHLAVEIVIGVLSRLDDSHPSAVEGAIHVGDCRCDSGAGLRKALEGWLSAQRDAGAGPIGTGQYL